MVAHNPPHPFDTRVCTALEHPAWLSSQAPRFRAAATTVYELNRRR